MPIANPDATVTFPPGVPNSPRIVLFARVMPGWKSLDGARWLLVGTPAASKRVIFKERRREVWTRLEEGRLVARR